MFVIKNWNTILFILMQHNLNPDDYIYDHGKYDNVRIHKFKNRTSLSRIDDDVFPRLLEKQHGDMSYYYDYHKSEFFDHNTCDYNVYDEYKSIDIDNKWATIREWDIMNYGAPPKTGRMHNNVTGVIFHDAVTIKKRYKYLYFAGRASHPGELSGLKITHPESIHMLIIDDIDILRYGNIDIESMTNLKYLYIVIHNYDRGNLNIKHDAVKYISFVTPMFHDCFVSFKLQCPELQYIHISNARAIKYIKCNARQNVNIIQRQ